MAPINHCKQGKNRLKAMTLVELLIVVSIIAILASFAYPAYQTQVIHGNRSVALSDLVRIQLYLENGYNGGYSDGRDVIMSGGSCQLCESNNSHYLITIVADNHSYTISADPQSNQEQDSCLTNRSDIITLDHSGHGKPKACWK